MAMSDAPTPLFILLTNDDGIHAQGLWAMYRALTAQGHHVDVVAPDRERSAVSHGVTLHQPIKAHKAAFDGGCRAWAVTGTPADCVKLAVAELLPRSPDLVVTGINPGANVGIDLNYSGTVAAAREAALCGLKAMAVSVQNIVRPRFAAAAEFAARLAAEIHRRTIPAGIFVNVNIPDLPVDKISGVRLTAQGNGHSEYSNDAFTRRSDPRNQTYYWYNCESQTESPDSDSDDALLQAGYVTITPLKCDMTDYDSLKEMGTWNIESI
jgi:5'-nucleotidase